MSRRRRNADSLLAQAQEDALASQLSDLREYERRSAFTSNEPELKRASIGERSHEAVASD